jgi:hypothetical protein
MATENAIRELLGLSPLNLPEVKSVSMPMTPETYLGYARGHSYIVEIKPGEIENYDYTKPLGEDQVGLRGPWQAEEEYITPKRDDCYLTLNFLAKRVYLVLSGSSKEPIHVTLDGKSAGQFKMDGDRKYDIVSTTYKRHQLALKIPQGVNAYAFTFGAE